LRVVIADDRLQSLGLESSKGRPFAARDAAKRIAGPNPPSSVHRKAELQLPGTAACIVVHRDEEGLQLLQLRGNAQMNDALVDAFAQQRALSGLQIAQAAMHQLAGFARCADGWTALLVEQFTVAGGCGRWQYTCADDDHIVLLH
jgi:hypothetical protein